ncbi:MAG: hypothetical protein QME94_10775 [Anaerolineae bacterium]|nr:hypothetical protein [Anaerolineae bacterium]
MPYAAFDRSRLRLRPLGERVHDLTLADWLALEDPAPPFDHPDLPTLAARILSARQRGAAVVLLMGGHVIRAGVSRHLIDLLERRLISHVGMNGAAAIHDYELALIGATTESVARYIREGQFGLWSETGGVNDAIARGAREGIGAGEAIGRAIAQGGFPHRDLSVLAACYRLRVPTTVHVGIGYDIIHEHPNCDGAALGAASYQDFLILAQTILGGPQVPGLEGGVLLSFGTAVMGPEVFLKALAMARNVALGEGREITHFTTAVFDLMPLVGDLSREAERDTPQYYFRPYKTLLVRTVAGGGESYYFRGPHRATIPALRRLLLG